MTQEAPGKVLLQLLSEVKELVGAESDVHVISAVTCCIIV